MKDKTTKMLVIVAVILAIIYFFKDKIINLFVPKEVIEDQTATSDALNTPIKQPTSPTDWEVYKKIGDKGVTVKEIQKLINSCVYWANHTNLVGVNNDARIKQVRSIKGISEDGVFGKITASACVILVGKNTTNRKEMYDKAIDFKTVSQNSKLNYTGV